MPDPGRRPAVAPTFSALGVRPLASIVTLVLSTWALSCRGNRAHRRAGRHHRTCRIEHEVRALNVELEDRVQKRTEELRKANAQLSTTVEHLQLAQSELVRSEKLASLGSWSPAWPTN